MKQLEHVKIRTATVHLRPVGEINTLCGKWSGSFAAMTPWPGLDACKRCECIKNLNGVDREYCWRHDHAGGWDCSTCLEAQEQRADEDSEAYRDFLQDTVDDAEYNAWLDFIHTPRAEDY